ncbi:MAG: MBL fold metallo-hydrolase [Verrucomicrobia bacterium]|nr:MBL fold metallo-hydrolase [Verrucomicrobiota bacterium]MBS0636911.1 MBL fold metallo-hydrolase [Verrucomicrobiota bacterium]
MKLTFIGTGSAFTVGGNYQSNMLFHAESGKNLLIDCGSDARHALFDLGLNHDSIDAVYISHLHADHIGGLEWLAFTTMFYSKKTKKVDLYCHESLLAGLWNALSGGLCSLEDTPADLSTYFTVHPLKDDATFIWEAVPFHLIRTIHQVSNKVVMPSYGLELVVDGIRVLITTDTMVSFPLDVYEKADIIFQDCETASVKSNVHLHYDELVRLPAEIKKKMCLYHYQPGALPDAKKDGFCCFIHKGQTFTFKADNR